MCLPIVHLVYGVTLLVVLGWFCCVLVGSIFGCIAAPIFCFPKYPRNCTMHTHTWVLTLKLVRMWEVLGYKVPDAGDSGMAYFTQ